MDELWFTQIEPRVFTVVKNRMRNGFPNVGFTTDNMKVEESKFPMVLIQELEPVEMGRDLDNVTVNAVLSSFQIQVFSKTAAENKDIMSDAVLQMKKLRFNVTMFPIYTWNADKTIRLSSARFQRVIGGGDRDIIPQD
jgi:hypothetical protein